jgi:hypothetical protein
MCECDIKVADERQSSQSFFAVHIYFGFKERSMNVKYWTNWRERRIIREYKDKAGIDKKGTTKRNFK